MSFTEKCEFPFIIQLFFVYYATLTKDIKKTKKNQTPIMKESNDIWEDLIHEVKSFAKYLDYFGNCGIQELSRHLSSKYTLKRISDIKVNDPHIVSNEPLPSEGLYYPKTNCNCCGLLEGYLDPSEIYTLVTSEESEKREKIEELNPVEEFLKEWRKENNTDLAVYSSYHIDAMEAYLKSRVEAISDELENKISLLRDVRLKDGWDEKDATEHDKLCVVRNYFKEQLLEQL